MKIRELNLGVFAPVVLDEQLTIYKNITKLNISKSVKIIPIGAFSNFKSLKKIYFEPNSLMTCIPEYAFSGCSNLVKISQLPSSIVSIDDYAFANCVSIDEIVIPESVAYIGIHTFDGWTELQDIYIYRPYEFSKACKANIISRFDKNDTEHEIDSQSDQSKEFYIVKAKCGHVGRQHYIPISFPVQASSKKEAVSIILQKGRVKRNHKDAILDVKKVNQQKYLEQIEINRKDPYLHIKSRHEQDDVMTDIKDRLVKDPHYKTKKNKRVLPEHRRDVTDDFKRKKSQIENY